MEEMTTEITGNWEHLMTGVFRKLEQLKTDMAEDWNALRPKTRRLELPGMECSLDYKSAFNVFLIYIHRTPLHTSGRYIYFFSLLACGISLNESKFVRMLL